MRPSKIDPATAALCEQDPHAAAVRDMLLDFEHDRHRLGWGEQPRLFMAAQDRETGAVKMLPRDRSQEMFVKGLETAMLAGLTLSVANALEFTAKVLEQLRVIAPLGDLFEEADDLGPTWGFYGFGTCMEMYMLPAAPMSLVAEVVRRKGPTLLHMQPEKEEGRRVEFVARDGMVWMLGRRRGHVPVVEGGKAEELDVGGNVLHVLARMTSAVADTRVHVRDAETYVKEHSAG